MFKITNTQGAVGARSANDVRTAGKENLVPWTKNPVPTLINSKNWDSTSLTSETDGLADVHDVSKLGVRGNFVATTSFIQGGSVMSQKGLKWRKTAEKRLKRVKIRLFSPKMT